MASDNGGQTDTDQVRVSITLEKDILEVLDQLKAEYGVRTRERVIEILLRDLIGPDE